MKHLTDAQILELIDQTLEAEERDRLREHVSECSRCRTELDLQRAVGRVVRHGPLARTSAAFTANVMAHILRREKKPVLSRIPVKVGSFVALLALVGLLGYDLMRTSTEKPPEQVSETPELIRTISSFYAKAEGTLVQQSTQIVQWIAGGAAESHGDLILVVLLSVVALIAFDRFVLQQFMRKRL